MLPTSAPSVDPAMRSSITRALADIETEFNVTVVFAVESGSRAWEFPSPDSDYDVRFLYQRPLESDLAIEPGRDVIELPIEDNLDINGWDLRKALGLLIEPNPVLLEWLSSPIRYIWREAASERLLTFAATTAHAPAWLHHYLNLGRRQRRLHIEGRDAVNYKKYFYALRPALALHWLRMRPNQTPPMNLQALAAGLHLEAEALDAIAALLAKKAQARETGTGPRIAPVDRLIEDAYAWADETTPETARKNLQSDADSLFRALILESANA